MDKRTEVCAVVVTRPGSAKGEIREGSMAAHPMKLQGERQASANRRDGLPGHLPAQKLFYVKFRSVNGVRDRSNRWLRPLPKCKFVQASLTAAGSF